MISSKHLPSGPSPSFLPTTDARLSTPICVLKRKTPREMYSAMKAPPFTDIISHSPPDIQKNKICLCFSVSLSGKYECSEMQRHNFKLYSCSGECLFDSLVSLFLVADTASDSLENEADKQFANSYADRKYAEWKQK